MNDLISRQAALDAVNGNILIAGLSNARAVQEYIRILRLKIHDLPAVDAVPVVRCRDCRFATWYTAVDGVKRCFCDSHGSAGHTETDFCSYAEREEMD